MTTLPKPILHWIGVIGLRAGWGFLVGGSLLLGGCGSADPPTWAVSGQVNFSDGSPVSFGVIEFAPIAGGPVARGQIDPAGHFVLATGARTGAVAGRHRIAIIQVVMNDGAPADFRPKHVLRLVHSRYNSFGTANLEWEVEPHDNNVRVIEVDPSTSPAPR